MNANIRPPSSHNIEVKEKISSDAALFLMNPVASGDNMLTGVNNGQKIKDELLSPLLVPCCEGKELQINEELVCSGLSAISVKHDSVVQCMSMSYACEKMQVPSGLVKHRNSFRSLHRPDLKRVPYLRRMTPDELETLFRGFADLPVHFDKNDIQKVETRPAVLPSSLPDERIVPRNVGEKTTVHSKDNIDGLLHPIPEKRSHTEDVPDGMMLHGTRARLYTSVLAGAKAGDQLE
ncbi:jg13169 [Pararge aegeria aegeria]|uniref:Jg13169 protein n=1 Tax=Pararge aegeria aegeria TaxID=348720 RepID=A0A8S4RTE1_9NEOP|nr:jg13169 [Pararge aegeria aegeria]